MHITLTANTDWYLHNFRLDLARAVRDTGFQVSLVCPDGPYVAPLEDQGFPVHTFPVPEDGFSITAHRRARAGITDAYRVLRPDLVHLFTPLCVLHGTMAATKLEIPYRVAALTGLGHVFTSRSLMARTVRPGMRWVLQRELKRPGTAVVFQNAGDQAELTAAGVVEPSRSHLIRGSGVDIERFQPKAPDGQDSAADASGRLVILFASRLLREKGIEELVSAFESVRAAQPIAELWVAGEPYAANPTSLDAQDIDQLRQQEGVRLLGHVDDMPALLGEVDIVALPSYREGTPKILLEAAACGLPIVATDIPGCQGVVEDGESGYLVPVKHIEPLADALLKLAGDPILRQRMGSRGRKIIEEGFSSDSVVSRTLEVYRSLYAL